MTRIEFEKLPLLLASRDAAEVLGCDRKFLRQLRLAYPALAVRLKGMKHWRYRKQEVAKVAGLE